MAHRGAGHHRLLPDPIEVLLPSPSAAGNYRRTKGKAIHLPRFDLSSPAMPSQPPATARSRLTRHSFASLTQLVLLLLSFVISLAQIHTSDHSFGVVQAFPTAALAGAALGSGGAPVGGMSASALTPGLPSAGPSSATPGAELGPCRTCVQMIELIKQGARNLDRLCSDMYRLHGQVTFGHCHHLVSAASLHAENLLDWLTRGCYKYEIYDSREWVAPCPSHVICSALLNLDDRPFCAALLPEDPFALPSPAAAGGSTGGSASGGAGLSM